MGHRPLNPDGESSRTARFRFPSGGRRIPCFFILAISVVRFIPNRAAAPYGPPTNHPVPSSAPRIRVRSASLSVRELIYAVRSIYVLTLLATSFGLFEGV